MIHTHRRLTLAGSSALLLALLATGLAGPAGASTGDTLGSELMRLTNLDRTALGKSALTEDPTLVAFAQGKAWTCPGTTMVLSGRSLDMAHRKYFSHSIKSCASSSGATYSSLDIMRLSFHYNTSRGENIAWNKGYSTTSTVTYGTGCVLGASGMNPSSKCQGSASGIVYSVAVAQRGFMNSSGHRSNLLGAYDRFGCASGIASDGSVYYTCVFSKGGPAVAVTDAVLPRVTSESGQGGIYARGRARTFFATLSDNVGLRSGSVSFDGRMLKSWTFDGSIRSIRLSIRVSAVRMKTGYHTIVWHSGDTSGHASTYGDGRVRFRLR